MNCQHMQSLRTSLFSATGWRMFLRLFSLMLFTKCIRGSRWTSWQRNWATSQHSQNCWRFETREPLFTSYSRPLLNGEQEFQRSWLRYDVHITLLTIFLFCPLSRHITSTLISSCQSYLLPVTTVSSSPTHARLWSWGSTWAGSCASLAGIQLLAMFTEPASTSSADWVPLSLATCLSSSSVWQQLSALSHHTVSSGWY